MPKLGESITEAAIIKWFKSIGDTIEEDETLLEVATDKVDSEVPSTVSGIVEEILFNPNEVVKIGDVIAVINTTGIVESSRKINKEKKDNVRPGISPNKNKHKKLRNDKVNLHFSPLIIEIARNHHISFEELAQIPSSGVNGRLRKSDVFKYIQEGRPFKWGHQVEFNKIIPYSVPKININKGTGKIVKMDRMRKTIADHMVFSKHTSPHVTAYAEADLTNIVNWRNRIKNSYLNEFGEKITYTPIFIELIAKAIIDFPLINVSVEGDTIIVKEDVNIGMATALPNGNLIVPVVKRTNKKILIDLVRDVNNLARKARTNSLSPEDIKGGTFTLSNVGTFGSLMGTPIINQPEVAILALGVIKKRPVVVETQKGEEITIRNMMYLSLSFDHRAVDGNLGGSFLNRIAHYMETFDTNRKI